jgi:hypothetical protein
MIEQGTPEWHELRRGKVTASRVADILSRTKTGPSASRQNYLIELALQRTTKTIEPSYTNAAMEWGTQTEPQARVAYEVATNNFVDQVAFIDHPTIEWFGCSPDGLVGENLIEINGAVIGFFFIYFIPGIMHFKCLYIKKKPIV